MTIDQVHLHFDPKSLQLLNVILGAVMFGVALDLSLNDFLRLFRRPKSVIVGLTTQLALLPLFTFCLVWLLHPPPSIALGMILVAACPGGNVSNFITHLSRGNTSLSVTMTAFCTIAAIFATPFHLSFWGGLLPHTQSLMKTVRVNYLDMFWTIAVLLGLPLFLGMLIASKLPKVAELLRKPLKILSLAFFAAFVLLAFRKNYSFFLQYIHHVFLLVLIHNTCAFALGYSIAALSRLSARDRRAVTIEVGIQNSGLGLILIFNFFKGLGGMAIVAAWWGIWHILAGMSVAFFFGRRALPVAELGAVTDSVDG